MINNNFKNNINVRRIVSLIFFILFLFIGVGIYSRQKILKENIYREEVKNINDNSLAKGYYGTDDDINDIIDDVVKENDYENDETKKISSPYEDERIISAKNEEYKEKILKLVNDFDEGKIKSFDDEYRDDIENILRKNRAKFFGDSNTEHFRFYNVLSDDLIYAMVGKDINKQRDLIDESLISDLDNIIFFNGYNLDKFNTADEYVEAYVNLIKKIKSIKSDINIYICSLLPATEKAIDEDIKSPLPQHIYMGREFDRALENYDFEDAIYINTKYFVKDEWHKDDGVHMNKTFYEILIPYVTYYICYICNICM